MAKITHEATKFKKAVEAVDALNPTQRKTLYAAFSTPPLDEKTEAALNACRAMCSANAEWMLSYLELRGAKDN